jgi:hypothetical protein
MQFAECGVVLPPPLADSFERFDLFSAASFQRSCSMKLEREER